MIIKIKTPIKFKYDKVYLLTDVIIGDSGQENILVQLFTQKESLSKYSKVYLPVKLILTSDFSIKFNHEGQDNPMATYQVGEKRTKGQIVEGGEAYMFYYPDDYEETGIYYLMTNEDYFNVMYDYTILEKYEENGFKRLATKKLHSFNLDNSTTLNINFSCEVDCIMLNYQGVFYFLDTLNLAEKNYLELFINGDLIVSLIVKMKNNHTGYESFVLLNLEHFTI